MNSNVDKSGTRYRFAPDEVLSYTYYQNKEMYDWILADLSNEETQLGDSVLLISGCEDHELDMDLSMARLELICCRCGMMVNLLDQIKNLTNRF